MAREFVLYRGEKFWLQTKGRYFQSGRKSAKERLLHRRIWIDTNGPIPAGHDVHHKDGNWRNSVPANLELIENKEHARQHMTERNAADVTTQFANLEKAREAAKEWHASPEGIAWHVKNGKLAWKDRKEFSQKCVRCKKPFKTLWPAKTCSKACREAVSYKRSFDQERACACCGKAFMANRYRTTRYCSRACSNKHRAGVG